MTDKGVHSRQERVGEEKESGTKRVPGKGNDRQSKRQARGDNSRQGDWETRIAT
jgi:hypothetical protein